jgi:hypothetical protein
MSRITRVRKALAYDDRLDVLAMAVGFWTEMMAQDAQSKITQRREEELDRELERFMEHAVGRKPRGDTWMSL